MPQTPKSLKENWQHAQALLAASELASARLDARFLLEFAGQCRYRDLLANDDNLLTEAQQQSFNQLIERRAAGEPLAYLLGHTDFRGLDLRVTPAVLIPRADTEVLVDLALEKISHTASPSVIDLGTGSGAVALCIAHERRDAIVSAVDLSEEALSIARHNADTHQLAVRFLAGSWFEPVHGEQFDLIVSNPPYIAEGDPHLSGDGLPFEPPMALSDGEAGGNGLACIRHIVAHAAAHLKPGGWLLFEHGYDQGEASRNLLAAAGFKDPFTQTDLAGTDRVSGGHF